MGKPEGIIEDYLMERAKAFDCLCYKFTSPSETGVPDRIIITPKGSVVFVELKSETGVLRAKQKVVISRMLKHKAPVFVINSKSGVDIFYEYVLKNTYKNLCTAKDIPDIIKPETHF